MQDIFRPSREPARAIYDAFQAEAEKRNGRDFKVWTEAEENAVWNAARDAAQKLALEAPTIEDVQSAQISAMGHVDYGAKWAYGIVHKMKPINHSK